ncbi:nuclease-related domain-containing protein [Alkalihalobacillus sp. 1P02AB]|uniref:nuclease-related domain-containing protein n=1 Tax=Alkalihalobacillus sp. 1P02AB TaxID=3132260 RepID=UPI0039A66A00
MIEKTRQKPIELSIWHSLKARGQLLTEEDAQHILHLEKGLKGERQFDEWTADLPEDWIQLHDLLLEKNKTIFQLDSLIITPSSVLLFEVKNYEGAFIYEENRFYTQSKLEIKNPLEQLNRSESLLRQLFQEYHLQPPPITSYVIFINPEFHLFQADPHNPHFIFPPLMTRFKKKLLQQPYRKMKASHKKLAEFLLTSHLKQSPHSRIPVYEYSQLNKGIFCSKCNSLETYFSGHYLLCRNCHYSEKFYEAANRSIKEFRLLFPKRKLTTSAISEWCKLDSQKRRTLQRLLTKKYKLIGGRKSSYYVDK